MPSPPTTIAALRSLLAVRFPERSRRSTGVVRTGIRSIDDALEGGLHAGKITELVSTAPGTGGQTVLAQLLRVTRVARQRVALIDGANGFVAEDIPADALKHLVWVRAHGAAEALAATDIAARDGNYAVVIVDLRGLSERTLLKSPASTWHRLRHAIASGTSALLVQTTTPLVPAVSWRLLLQAPPSPGMRRSSRAALADALTVEVTRGHVEIEEESA